MKRQIHDCDCQSTEDQNVEDSQRFFGVENLSTPTKGTIARSFVGFKEIPLHSFILAQLP